MQKILRNRAAMLWCAAVVILAALPALLLPAGAGWITDNGNKYIIMRSLAEQGSTAITSPAAGIDPGGRFFPDGGFHFRRFNGEMRSIYPEYFPALTLPFYRLFGERGVLFLPVLGAAAAALLFGFWRRRAATGLILLAGTPLLFYGGTFWEMAPSVFFALAAVMLAVRRRLFLAGVVMGAGLILREEMYFLAAATAAGLLFAEPRRWRGVLRFEAGFAVAALPLLLWQFHSFGHVLGLHGALYYSHNRIAPPTVWEQLSGCLEGYYLYLLQFNAGAPEFRWYYPLLFSPMLLMAAAGAAPEFGAWRKFKHGAFALASAAWLILVVMLWRTPVPAMAAGVTVGLFTGTPLMAGFLLNWRALLRSAERSSRLLAALAIVYILLTPPLLTRSDIGIIWGPRHFLCLMPILLLLSFAGWRKERNAEIRRALAAGGPDRAVRRGRMLRLIPATALFFSLAISLFGMWTLFGVAGETAHLTGKLRALAPEVVISDLFFLPEQTPQLFFEKRWLFVKDDAAAAELPALLARHGVRHATLVLSPRFRNLSDDALRRLLTALPLAAPPERFPAPVSGFLELFLGEVRLQSP